MTTDVKTGRLEAWNKESGFGFIIPHLKHTGNTTEQQVFVHITDFTMINRAPQPGDFIEYQATPNAEGRLRASVAYITEPPPADLKYPKLAYKCIKKTRLKVTRLNRVIKRWCFATALVLVGYLVAKGYSLHTQQLFKNSPTPDTVASQPR